VARYQPQHALLVQLQSIEGSWIDVGVLNYANEITWFESNSDYWETPGRPVLGQIFEERGRVWNPSARLALPDWFSHLLPEGALRAAVSAAAGVNPKREFFLLSRIGFDDLHGAVRVRPWPVSATTPPSSSGISDTQHAETEPESPFLKYSLAGVQLKFSVRLENQKGLTIPARGRAGDWIVKLPDGRPNYDGVPEAELGCLELARRVGIEVTETKLVSASDISGVPGWVTEIPGKSFAIKRYDRFGDDGRVHAEELAQVLNIPTGNEKYKYRRANFETVASTIAALCGPEAVGAVIERITLNVLVGNGDAHLKNWSIIYPDGRLPALSPLYDVLPTVLYIPEDDLGLKLNGTKNFNQVQLNSFDRLAIRAGWGPGDARQKVAETVDKVTTEWRILRDYLPEERYKSLTKRREDLSLVQDVRT
jgi:serine/threonine-protein kinase HipA